MSKRIIRDEDEFELVEDFFDQKGTKQLRREKNGADKIIIYIKMMFLTDPHDGLLKNDEIGETFAEDISLAINEDEELITDTLESLSKYKLIEYLDDDTIFIPGAKIYV